MHIIKYFKLLGLYMILALCAQAQTSQDAESVSIKFQVITWNGIVSEIYFDSVDDELQEIKAFSHVRSAIYDYTGPKTLTFYRKATNPNGERIKQVVGQVAIAPDARKLLFILAENDDETFKVIQIPDDSTSFPYGSFQFLNLTNLPIAAMVQDEKILLKPRMQKLQRIPENSDGSNLSVKIALGKPEGWKMFYANSWGHNNNRRTLVLIFEADNGKHVVKRFREEAPKTN